MTATLSTTADRGARLAGSARRVRAMARAEVLLLRRSPVALLNAVVAPAALVGVARLSVPPDLQDTGPVGPTIVAALIGFTLLLAVYYNLVTVLVARREELVLKRLRTGEPSDTEILTAVATPAVAVAGGQSLVGVVVVAAVFGLSAPVNPVLVAVALGLGTVVFVLLAVLTTTFTRSVETAQVSTVPAVLPSLLLSGLMVPADSLPGGLDRLGQVLPLTAVVDLLQLGLTGTTRGGDTVTFAESFLRAGPSALILVVWIVATAGAARRWLRWEPRR